MIYRIFSRYKKFLQTEVRDVQLLCAKESVDQLDPRLYYWAYPIQKSNSFKRKCQQPLCCAPCKCIRRRMVLVTNFCSNMSNRKQTALCIALAATYYQGLELVIAIAPLLLSHSKKEI